MEAGLRVLRKELSSLGRVLVTAETIKKNALLTLDSGTEELFRIFYYDAAPFEGRGQNPIDGVVTDFSQTGTFRYGKRVLEELGQMDQVALRIGVLKPRGWTLTDGYVSQAIKNALSTPPKTPALLTPSDVEHSLEQKGVDMRIGIDVAALAIKRHVDRIVLLSGDSDMIPAMKLARREGIQVCVVQVGDQRIISDLIEDADFLRKITPLP